MENGAGYDTAPAEEIIIPTKGKTIMKTGISIAVPNSCYATAPLSGLIAKCFIDVCHSIIDTDYKGEIKRALFSHSNEDYRVK